MTTSVECSEGLGYSADEYEHEVIDLTQGSESDSSVEVDYVDEDTDEDEEIMDITLEVEQKIQREQRLQGIHYAKRGKKYYNVQDYNMATQCFKTAIETDGTNFEYFYYKSMSLYNLLELHGACNDAKTAVKFAWGDEKYKCLMWLLQLKTEMGEVKYCEDIINSVKEYRSSAEEFKKAEANLTLLSHYLNSLNAELIAEKIIHLSFKALEIAPKCINLLLMQAKAYIDCEKYWDARITCLKALKYDNHNAKAMYLQSRCFYYGGEISKARISARDALKQKSNEEAYVSLFNGLDCIEKELAKAIDCKNHSKFSTFKDFTQAKCSYQRCLEILSSPEMKNKTFEAEICFNMGEIANMERKSNEALEWCDKAIGLNEEYTEAFVLKGNVEMSEYLFKDAQANYKKALALAPSDIIIRRKLDAASESIASPDYYGIMGIEKTASIDTIKLAYKKFLLKFHPDKNSGASQTELDINKRRLEKIKEANDILSDLKKKAMYDNSRGRGVVVIVPSCSWDLS